ncbi:MAG: diguanylate cyclase [Pseudomonas sp.]
MIRACARVRPAWLSAKISSVINAGGAGTGAQQHSRCLAFLDLNDFKAINDRNGHAIGDQVLTFTTKQLKQMLRPADTTSQGWRR